MATSYKKPVPNKQTTAPPYTSPVPKQPTSAPAPRGNQVFLFDRSNYIWVLAGLGCILLGFLLMSGGKSPDPHQFNYKEIYSARRITIAPLLILIGFGLEAYAILKGHTPKDTAAPEDK